MSLHYVLVLGALAFVSVAMPARGNIANFSDLSLNPNSYSNNSAFNSHEIGFNNDYDPTYGDWSGFSYSNVVDATTPGYGNQYASYAGGGAVDGGSNYAVAYPESIIDLPLGQHAVSVSLTNTTYAALSMKNGDSFAKKFGGATGNDPDYFDVTLTGYSGEDATGSVTGAVTFYLADYRFADNTKDYIVNQWTNVNLAPLGGASSISLSFDSSDVGTFGINTPTYVALDDLATVPEPASLGLISLLGVAAITRRTKSR